MGHPLSKREGGEIWTDVLFMAVRFGSRVPPEARATGPRMEPVSPEQAPSVAIAAARSGQVPGGMAAVQSGKEVFKPWLWLLIMYSVVY